VEKRTKSDSASGRLFYLMGASGVGKDSLLQFLQAHLPADAPVRLPHRYITRPMDAGGEAHIEIGEEIFHWQAVLGGFAMHWDSHGFHYGIGRDIDAWLAQGLQVVLNGSRHYLETAHSRYPNLQPILVSVSHDALFERLTQRGRENIEEIERRLQRAEALDRALAHGDLTILHNDGPLCEAGERLLELVLAECQKQPEITRVKAAYR
jgi:ribose 1,5-bisphosphokinase